MTLTGFSRDAIVVLESTKAEPGLASCVIAFDRRYVSLPETASTVITIHSIHGGKDPAIDLAHAVATQGVLISAGGDVAPNIVEDLGHAIDNRNIQLALDRLRYTIPKYYSDETLSSDKPGDDDVIETI